MRHGEIVRERQQVLTWVVVSADGFNAAPGAHPVVVPLVRRKGFGSEYAVETNEMDTIAGSVLVPYPEVLPDTVDTERVGLLTGQTMSKVQAALRLLYGL